MPNEPFIKFDPTGTAPVISYSLPEPTSYTGKNFIELKFDNNEDLFKPEYKKLEDNKQPGNTASDPSTVKSAVLSSMKAGFRDKNFFLGNLSNSINISSSQGENHADLKLTANVPVSKQVRELKADDIADMKQKGLLIKFGKLIDGTLDYRYVPEPKAEEIRPRFMVVESYGLSSFLGKYGAGRVIKTFSLLPGEKTKISIKSYTKRSVDSKSASSILDSVTEESAREFEDSLEAEQSDKGSYSNVKDYYGEAEASASWGFGSASAKAGFKTSSASSREEFSKNVSKATEKHAAKASAKRDVQINTSYEVREETGEETSIERQIENINLSRTLNFVFRQMNQEFITLLHLLDIRVAFFNGNPAATKEVSISQLDALLDEVMVDDTAKKKQVRDEIMNNAVREIFDYEDNIHQILEEVNVPGGNIYQRVKKNIISEYVEPFSHTTVRVKGIITAVTRSVLRTEGVIVETMLGEGLALDGYATKLQDLEVQLKEKEKEKLEAEIERLKAVTNAASSNPDLMAEVVKNTEKCSGDALKIKFENVKNA